MCATVQPQRLLKCSLLEASSRSPAQNPVLRNFVQRRQASRRNCPALPSGSGLPAESMAVLHLRSNRGSTLVKPQAQLNEIFACHTRRIPPASPTSHSPFDPSHTYFCIRISYHIISYHIIPYHIISYHVISTYIHMGVSENRGTLFGVLIVRILLFRVLY